MKKIFLMLQLLGSMALGSGVNGYVEQVMDFVRGNPKPIVLDTKLVSREGNASSLYKGQEGVANKGWCYSRIGKESRMNFYVDVQNLYGAGRLKDGHRYRLDSISWIGHPQGRFTGRERRVVISNGEDSIARPIPETKKDRVTVKCKSKKNAFLFEKNDILTVTLCWDGSTEDVLYMVYYDAPPYPGKIMGTAMNLRPDGTFPRGDGTDNAYVKAWRYNCPAVRIRVTPVDEVDIVRLSAIGAGVLLVLFVLRAGIGKRKKR